MVFAGFELALSCLELIDLLRPAALVLVLIAPTARLSAVSDLTAPFLQGTSGRGAAMRRGEGPILCSVGVEK